jgi:NAD(P)-dependent dehydrogenase (short-subunit alcohol dehydrogenase family)
MRRLRGQVALVTGASSGIGRAAAIALAGEGAGVTVAGRDRPRVEETAARVRERGGEALALVADVRREDDMERAVRETLDAFGRLDVLIASAGRGATRGPRAVVQMPADEWDEIIDTNLKGVFLSNRAVLPAMIRQRSGTILNVSSARGATGATPYAAAYAASKHGLMGLTAALAEEMRAYNVRVMALLPDATDTPLIARAHATAPRGKMTPEAVAGLMLEMILEPHDMLWRDPLLAPFAAGGRVGTAPTGEPR